MSEISIRALDMALQFHNAKGAGIADRIGATDIVQTASVFRDFLLGNAAAAADPVEDKPKTTRGRKSKDDSAPADGAASEPSSPNASQLEPADEKPVAVEEPKPEPVEPAAAASTPSRDDVLTAATKFSHAHGPDALMAALKEVGAAKFSNIPTEKYQAFLDAMDKHGASASALS